MIETTVEDQALLDALRALQARLADLKPALLEIGEELQNTTMRRFANGTGPDGQSWEANAQATLVAFFRRKAGIYDKQTGQRIGDKLPYYAKGGRGRVSAKGAAVIAGKRPLLGESLALSGGIDYHVEGNTLVVGSPMEYAAMQQFGGKKGDFPHLWGDIPARPFLGVSAEDEQAILAVLRRHLLSAVE